MSLLLRLALVALIFVVAWVFVQRILAARRGRIAGDVLRLVRARGSIDLLDVCRALSLTPTVAEAVLKALVEGGHLKLERGLEGSERWRAADVPDLPEPEDDGPVN
jgi:hypothetical protein